MARRARGRAHQRPGRPRVQRVPGQPLGHVRLPRVRGRPRGPAGAAGRRRGLAARARARPHDRADGLHDQRRERRADRGLRARADDQAALAPALLRGALRGGRAREGDGPVDVGARHLRPREDPPGRLRARRAGRAQARRADPQDDAALAARATWTASPTSTTRPGARTGASRRTPRRTSTTTRRSCSSSSTRRWFMVAEKDGETVGGGHHRARHQPGPAQDERAPAALRLVALPAPAQDHRPLPRRLPRRQARVPAHRAWPPRCTSSTSTWPTRTPHQVGRDGLDPRDQPRHEPRRWRP